MKRLNGVIAALIVLTIVWFLQPSQAMSAEAERITIEQLKSMLDDKVDVIVVDTRSRNSFEAGHIPGAISLDYPEEIWSGIDQLPRKKTIVFY